MTAQYEITYKIIGVGPGNRGITGHTAGTDHNAAYRMGVAYLRECQANRSRGIREVVMTATNYWGEVSVSGRWTV